MNIFSKEYGVALLVLLITLAAVLAACGIATLIAKIMKKDSVVLSKILAGIFAVIFLGTKIFYIIQLIPSFKDDKSSIGLVIGGWLVELAIALMLMIMIVERTKKNWLSLLLSLLPAAYSVYVLVTEFSKVLGYPTKYMKANSFVEYFGNVFVYVAVLVFCVLTTFGVIKNRKKAILFGMIPAIIAALCFVIRFAFTIDLYTDDLIITTVFDALKRSLMVIWCYGMALKAGESVVPAQAAPQAAPVQPQPTMQPNPQPQQFVQQPQQFTQQPQPFQPNLQFQAAQPEVTPAQPVAPQPVQSEVTPAQPVNSGYKFDPVTGKPIQQNTDATQN